MQWLCIVGGVDIRQSLHAATDRLLRGALQKNYNRSGVWGKERFFPLDDVLFGEVSSLVEYICFLTFCTIIFLLRCS